MQETDNDLIIELSEPQTAVLSARVAVLLDMAGQGSGKSQNIGYSSGMFISDLPEALGFIGANTEKQLSQSTLIRVFATWKEVYDFTEYDPKANPGGCYVVDKRPPAHFERRHRLRNYDGTISFWNGTLVFIGSLQNYLAHDGKEFAWAHLDETKDTEEEALKGVIIGRLRQYGLWNETATGDIYFDENLDPITAEAKGFRAWNPLYIHTSPASGGVTWLNEMFKLNKFQKEIKAKVFRGAEDYFYKEFDNKCVVIYSTYHNAHNLPPTYIENQKATLIDKDKIDRLVYAYPFAKGGGEYYGTFRRELIVKPVKYIKGEAVHAGWDFNSVPYMTLICCQVRYETRYKDQAGIKHTAPQPGFTAFQCMVIGFYTGYFPENPRNTTEATCHDFAGQHDPNVTDLYYYGDANGNIRQPGNGEHTQFHTVEEVLAPFIFSESKRVGRANLRNAIRRSHLLKIFAGQIPEIEIEIDPSVEKLIDDCENVKQRADGSKDPEVTKDENGNSYEKRGHPTDAMEYIVCDLTADYIV